MVDHIARRRFLQSIAVAAGTLPLDSQAQEISAERSSWRGEWGKELLYNPGDAVSFRGTIWMATSAGQNHQPGEDGNWVPFSAPLPDGSVTAEKIYDGSVSPQKLDRTADFGDVIGSSVWESGAFRTLKDRSRYICHVMDFDVDASFRNDSTAGLLKWSEQAQDSFVPMVLGGDASGTPARFALSQEIEIFRPGQIMKFDNTGYGGYGDNGLPSWRFYASLIGVGSFPKKVRTRRKFRANRTDPQDDPLSCMINIQAEGVELSNPSIWLECDYSNTDPTNMGADCDVGIGIFTRTGVKITKPVVTGYFRKAGILYDVTNGFGYPRFVTDNQKTYPDSSVNSGGDGCLLESPQIRGGRVGLAIVGASPQTGHSGYDAPYYDESLGALIQDRRGAAGFSDFLCLGGEIYGPDHHSNWRRKDPNTESGLLSSNSLENEPDFSPAALWIDGLANNPRKAIWGMRFLGTRFATYEAFRIRLGRSARTAFYSCHTEGRGNGARRTAEGAIIRNNDDSAKICWGDLSGTPDTCGFTAIDTVRQTYGEYAPHYYGNLKFPPTWSGYNARNRSGITEAVSFRASEGAAELWGDEGSGVNLRAGSTSLAQFNAAGVFSLSQASGYITHGEIVDIRGQAGGVTLRDGSTSVLQASLSGIQASKDLLPHTNATQNFGNPHLQWNNSYIATAPIIGSDSRYKKVRGPLVESEREAARALLKMVKLYQLVDAISEKGENGARLHVGFVAQEVISIMERHDLDWPRYGFIGEDPHFRTIEEKVKVTRPLMKSVTKTVERRERDGDRIVVRRIDVVEDEVVTIKLPVVDHEGNPILDDGGEQEFSSIPVTHEIEETIQKQVPVLDADGKQETRFKVRMDELLAFILAGI